MRQQLLSKSVWTVAAILSLATGLGAQKWSKTVQEIRDEACRKDDPAYRPLPLATHWFPEDGFSPENQLELIRQMHHILPAFSTPRWEATYYATKEIQEAAKLNLPITCISGQWPEMLYQDEAYLGIDAETVNGGHIFTGDKASASANPCLITKQGTVVPVLEPFGPETQVKLWQEVGQKWGGFWNLRNVQQMYSNPPRVVFISNNEPNSLVPKSRDLGDWDVDTSKRYQEIYIDEHKEGQKDPADFRRKVVGDGWIVRYCSLFSGFRNALTQPWGSKSVFVGFGAFGPSHFRRWQDWIGLTTTYGGQCRIDPWHFAWDGASPPFYLNALPAGGTDFTVLSPQMEAMNWVFMLEEVKKAKPDYWFELSVWDGYEPGNPSVCRRKWYDTQGQRYNSKRYGGMVQFGMWLMRPRAVREYRGKWDDTFMDYFLAVVEAVDRVYADPVLKEFWRKGQLVENSAKKHPYQNVVPDGYTDAQIKPEYGVGRYFLLTTSLDPHLPTDSPGYDVKNYVDTVWPVFALALVKGTPPKRQWLVYAHSPIQDTPNVEITIPGYANKITVNVGVAGSFWLVKEKKGTVTEIKRQNPHLASTTIKPGSAVLAPGAKRQFSAECLDQYGRPYAASVKWSTSGGGTIDVNGGYSTPVKKQTCHVIAKASGVSRSVEVHVTDLVAHWGFDEGKGWIAHDKTGNGHDGCLTNVSNKGDNLKPEWVEGKIGSALAFNQGFVAHQGDEIAYVDCDNSDDFTGGDSLTLTAWVEAKGPYPGQWIAAKGDYSNGNGYGLAVIDSRPWFYVDVVDANGVKTGHVVQAAGKLSADKMYHLAAVLSRDSIRLYVDGLPAERVRIDPPGAVVPSPPEYPFVIGKPSYYNEFFTEVQDMGGPFMGIIDDVRLYNRALTDEEVKKLANPK
jgi:hypothetical protein